MQMKQHYIKTALYKNVRKLPVLMMSHQNEASAHTKYRLEKEKGDKNQKIKSDLMVVVICAPMMV